MPKIHLFWSQIYFNMNGYSLSIHLNMWYNNLISLQGSRIGWGWWLVDGLFVYNLFTIQFIFLGIYFLFSLDQKDYLLVNKHRKNSSSFTLDCSSSCLCFFLDFKYRKRDLRGQTILCQTQFKGTSFCCDALAKWHKPHNT